MKNVCLGAARRLHLAPLLLAGLLLPAGGCSSAKPVTEISLADTASVENAPRIEVADADWPWWRGPGHDDKAVGAAPLDWSQSKNVVWKVDVPGLGYAAPVVWGEQVFVATADEQQQIMSLLCFDRQTGERRWTRQIHSGGFMHRHTENTQASATPACDGRRVYCAFMVQGGIWVTAVDLEGNIAWQTKAGDFVSQHGYGSSPVLYKSLVIVSGDNSGGGFLAALHTDSGKIAWKVRRDNTPSYATPVVAHVAGRDQLLLSGQDKLVSYNPVTGETLWTAPGPATTTANTVAAGDTLVFASGGYPQRNVMAVKADGSGEVVWEKQIKSYVPSPLLAGDHLLLVQDDGVATLLAASTGKEIWKRRLGGTFYASPVLAGDHVYVPNRSGTMYVFKLADKFERPQENFLAKGGETSPVICGGRIYIRTRNTLFCVGEPTRQANVEHRTSNVQR